MSHEPESTGCGVPAGDSGGAGDPEVAGTLTDGLEDEELEDGLPDSEDECLRSAPPATQDT